MTAKIYVDQVLRPLGLPFYKQCTEVWVDIIYMDNGAPLHIHPPKLTKKFCREMRPLRMIWPAQSPDLNPIENLWQIIKGRFSSRRHRIHTVEEMKVAISEEWEQLTEEDYRKVH